ncbi:MAG: adenylyl-sulfate kinase [Lamprobacter sp.]|uniref:adenylyl-sulfate kinase n=1 Tax=Lamprobacter sp. TaxID=3100796 RepID=UPI002B26021C|nr:adenylyl-sulfate kinase [Lamprobacter sp.]MEA3642823.1 adenylyl-sulfate kinase [Lamprobacter sp.]
MVIWITGLSGAGKSTLATGLSAKLRDAGRSVVQLDGDELRSLFDAETVNQSHHDRNARLALALRYARLCQVIASQGPTVVMATISLFREVHAWNRIHLPGYFELYLKVPLAELRRRDPKGLYQRFDRGELRDLAGLDVPIDEPQTPDWVAEFEPGQTADRLAQQVWERLIALMPKSAGGA